MRSKSSDHGDLSMSPQAPLPTTVAGPAGRLEISVEGFEQPAVRGIAIVCHPHPLHGGTMTNKVVHFLSRSLNELGFASLRFNFRGVGKSEGEFAEAIGETEDLLAVIDWVQQRFPSMPVWLAGFSFGAYVALSAASQRNVERLITVAPAVHLYDVSSLTPPSCPWLLIQGDSDEIVPIDQVRAWVQRLEKRPRTVYLKGVGHFFHGKLTLLRDVVVGALEPAAKQLPYRRLD